MQARLAAMNTNLKKASNAVSYSVDDKFFRYIDREQVKQLLYWERVASARKQREFGISTSLLNMAMSQPEHVLQHKEARKYR